MFLGEHTCMYYRVHGVCRQAFYSDLSEELKAKNLNDVELNELPLSCMFYADDLIIFSKSKNGLQDYLDSLSEYCKGNDLSVNLNKPKVLIFNNSRENHE